MYCPNGVPGVNTPRIDFILRYYLTISTEIHSREVSCFGIYFKTPVTVWWANYLEVEAFLHKGNLYVRDSQFLFYYHN